MNRAPFLAAAIAGTLLLLPLTVVESSASSSAPPPAHADGDSFDRAIAAYSHELPATAAFWHEWTTRQLVNPPRGYAFAVFATPSGKRIGFYSVHLKSNAMGRDVKDREKQATLNRLQRELAAQQLVEHVSEVSQLPDIAPDAVVIGGDFNTDPTQERFATERTHAVLERSDFLNPLRRLPIEKRTTIPATGRYPDTTFDYILVKGAQSAGDPVIHENSVSDHRPVTLVVTLP